MGRLFKRIQIILALTGLGMLFMNFSNPKLAQETIKAAKDPLIAKPLEKAETKGAAEKRYVKIDGKLFEYNPRNVYVVNGVPTMYSNGASAKTLEEWGVKGAGQSERKAELEEESAAPGDRRALHAVVEMVQKNPLAVYAPGGIKTVMDGAREAADSVNEARQALEKVGR